MYMAKRIAFVKTEEFNGWVCGECGWRYCLPQNPSDEKLAAAEKALQDHLEQKHREGPLNRTFGQSV
jgi:hypothetical protein